MSVTAQIFSLLSNIPLLLYAVIGLLAVWYILGRKRLPDKLPPFPEPGYPIVGHFPMLRRDGSIECLGKYKKKCGDIFSIYMGGKLTIVMSSMKILKEALVKKGENFSDRPLTPITIKDIAEGGLIGILANNGDSWKETRSVSMQILREFGMGKNWLDDKVSEEVQVYLDTLSEFKGQPTDVRMVTNAAVSNVICAILIGRRFELDDPDFLHLLTLMNEQVYLMGANGLATIFPFLRYLPNNFFGFDSFYRNFLNLNALFSEKFVAEIKKTGDTNNFIARFFDEVQKKNKANIPTHLDERNLMRVIGNLFGAGSETTSTTILWALLFGILHPEEQEKMHKEIIEVVGTGRLPNMADKPKLNYANAFIMECQRIGSIVPLSGLHVCSKTSEVAGYTIPEGSQVVPFIYEVMHDEAVWKDATVFRPERFIDENGEVFVPEEFVPFGVGRRYCMGDALARMELFLFITSIYQRFHVLPEDINNLPTTERIPGLTSPPVAYKVRLEERH